MDKNNCKRAGCVDVFGASLVKNATYDGTPEIPVIRPCNALPNFLKPFSQAITSKSRKGWVHFYEDDEKFERIWRSPQRYIKALRKFDGIITPDFSVYRDMPKVMQEWNIYRARAFGHALQEEGANVIVNLRFGDDRTFEIACLGAPRHSAFAIGSHGNLKNVRDRQIFCRGLDYAIRRLEPKTIVVYGAAPESIFAQYQAVGIRVVPFASQIAQAHKREK